MMTELLLKPVERLLNRSLENSHEAKQMATSLNQKSLSVAIKLHPDGEPIRVRVAVVDSQLQLSTDEQPANVEILGSPLGLLKLSGLELTRHLTGTSRIEGDAEIAKQFEILFKKLPVDLEAELADKIGDQPAYWIGQTIRRGMDYSLRNMRSMTRQGVEYLTEEINLLTPRTQIDAFIDDVEKCRDVAERL